jgi:hypothetical protein
LRFEIANAASWQITAAGSVLSYAAKGLDLEDTEARVAEFEQVAKAAESNP